MITELTTDQAAEISKYPKCYEDPCYRMSESRLVPSKLTLSELPFRGSYLDVSCGRGEMLIAARSLGFEVVIGTETVLELISSQDDVTFALAWDLPFNDRSFEVVSMFDVIEHLLPGDDERTCQELRRVASKAIIITANNLESVRDGVQLHINRRDYTQWDVLFRHWFPDAEVEWLTHRQAKKSEMWRILL